MWKLKIGEGGNNPWLRSTNGHLGRQVWEFHPELGTSDEISQVERAREEFRRNRFKTKNSSDLLLRLQYSKEKQTYMDLPPQEKLGDSDDVTEEAVSTSIRRALSSFSNLQAHDGHWPADFGAPMFLLPGLIITLYITGALNTLLSTEHVSEMRRFIYNHQNEDGGWGFHIEGHSTMFGSVLSYVTLRLLGEEAEGGDGAIRNGREWILQHGGATHTTQWGKFWLSVLGVFDWAGNNPLLPEMMLLPQILPFHPSRMWLLTRTSYLPMTYLYAKKFVGAITPTVLSLRRELYSVPYEKINWNQIRNACAKEDLYVKHSLIQDFGWAFLSKVEKIIEFWPFNKLRPKALSTAMQHIHYEDESTRYLCVGPVNKEDLYVKHSLIQDFGWAFLSKVEKIIEFWPFNKLRPKALSTAMQHIHYEDESTRYLCVGPVNKEDLYVKHSLIQDFGWAFLSKVEKIIEFWPFNKLRPKALSTAMQHIHYEDESTRYLCVGPVNKVINMLCCWVEDPNSEAYKLHLPRVYDFLWIAEDGMKMQAYNGTQLWDTVFAIQAIISTNIMNEIVGGVLKKAHDFIKLTQIQEDSPGDLKYWYRHISKGGWPFSTADNGHPVTDCTAEGLKVALLLSQISPDIVGQKMDDKQLYDGVNIILSFMNKNGGFGSYGLQNSYSWLELFNSSETFENIILDHPCIECTSSSIQALVVFQKLYPEHRRDEIEHCVRKAATFIEKMQRPDGSWYGTWGVCFTYGTWFGVSGLISVGRTYSNSICIRKACDFLLSKQLSSGGWGESYLSFQNKTYTNLEGDRSHAVNTAWAMLALLEAGQAELNPKPLHRAAKTLINMQMESGEFPQQDIMGASTGNITMGYAAYRNIFPIWALGEYQTRLSLVGEYPQEI